VVFLYCNIKEDCRLQLECTYKVTCQRVVFDHLAAVCYMPDLKITTTAHINVIVICNMCCRT